MYRLSCSGLLLDRCRDGKPGIADRSSPAGPRVPPIEHDRFPGSSLTNVHIARCCGDTVGRIRNSPFPSKDDARSWKNSADYKVVAEHRLASSDHVFYLIDEFVPPSACDETYGAGRFIYVQNQGNGRTVIDFNKAYNPPCLFTPYATCPLPPSRNHLNVRIEAGEKAEH